MLARQDDGLLGDVLADGTVQLQLQALHVGLAKVEKAQRSLWSPPSNVDTFTLELLEPGFQVFRRRIPL